MIELLENECSYEVMREFYKNLFSPSPEEKYESPIKRHESIEKRKEADLGDLKLYRSLTSTTLGRKASGNINELSRESVSQLRKSLRDH